jgi:hypothetical protein
MKTIVKIIALQFLLTVGFTSCMPEHLSEMHYAGSWKLFQYYNDGENQTMSYLNSHQYYTLYLQAGNQFSETWIEHDGVHDIHGFWRLTEDRRHLLLDDYQHGERKYDITYLYTIRLKEGDEEWILRKN